MKSGGPAAPRGTRHLRTLLEYLPRGQSLSEDVWRVRHRTLSYLLRAHVVGVFAFALIRGDDPISAASAASIIVVLPNLSVIDPRRRAFASAMNALGLVI